MKVDAQLEAEEVPKIPPEERRRRHLHYGTVRVPSTKGILNTNGPTFPEPGYRDPPRPPIRDETCEEVSPSSRCLKTVGLVKRVKGPSKTPSETPSPD